MFRDTPQVVTENRSPPTREEKDGDEDIIIRVFANGDFGVGTRRVVFDKDDGGETAMRKRSLKRVGWEDDVKSTLTSSTGQRSQLGATWTGSMDQTMNTGFGSNTRRTMNGRGVREGREREVEASAIYGVGRTGKGPAAVPVGLSRAASRKVVAVVDDEGEDGSDSDMSTTVEYHGHNGVDETAINTQQQLQSDKDRETKTTNVQVSQPKTKRSVKIINVNGATINGKAIMMKKTKEKEGSRKSKWRPKLTWFV